MTQTRLLLTPLSHYRSSTTHIMPHASSSGWATPPRHPRSQPRQSRSQDQLAGPAHGPPNHPALTFRESRSVTTTTERGFDALFDVSGHACCQPQSRDHPTPHRDPPPTPTPTLPRSVGGLPLHCGGRCGCAQCTGESRETIVGSISMSNGLGLPRIRHEATLSTATSPHTASHPRVPPTPSHGHNHGHSHGHGHGHAHAHSRPTTITQTKFTDGGHAAAAVTTVHTGTATGERTALPAVGRAINFSTTTGGPSPCPPATTSQFTPAPDSDADSHAAHTGQARASPRGADGAWRDLTELGLSAHPQGGVQATSSRAVDAVQPTRKRQRGGGGGRGGTELYAAWLCRAKGVWKAARRARAAMAAPAAGVVRVIEWRPDESPPDRLPDELLMAILTMLPGARCYVNALKTCRRWWSVGSHRHVATVFARERAMLRYATNAAQPLLAGGQPCPTPVWSVAFSQSGDELFGSVADSVRVWDCGSTRDTVPWVATIEHHDVVSALGTTPDSLLVGTLDGMLHCWNTRTDLIELGWTVKVGRRHDSAAICSIDAKLPGRVLVDTDPARDALGMWQLPDLSCDPAGTPPRCTQRFAATQGSPGHNEPVRVVHLGANGLVYSGSYDSTVKVWSLDGLCVDTIFLGQTAPTSIVTPAPHGVIIGCDDGSVRVYRYRVRTTAHAPGRADPHESPGGVVHDHTGTTTRHKSVRALAIVDTFLFSGGNNGVCVWRLLSTTAAGITLEYVVALIKTRAPVTSLAADPRKGCLAVATFRGALIYTF